MKAPLYDTTGNKLKDITLPKEIFDRTVDPKVLAQAVRIYLDNQHQDNAKAQTRGEVNRTHAKVYAQKHTGRARHGAKSAPTFVGGGKAHGPKGIPTKILRLPKKLRHLSVIGGLITRAKADSIMLLDNAASFDKKTKDLNTLITTLTAGKKTLLLTNKRHEALVKAGLNIKNLTMMPAISVNAYQLLKAKYVVIEHEAIDTLKDQLTKGLK